ncbi:putative toxin-antitoxin system toxin component, PIN family [Virgibacillus kimchii]
MSVQNDRLRIFVDSNVLISAILSQKTISSQLLEYAVENHRLVICSYSITEVSSVINNKFPSKVNLWDHFLNSFEFELTYTPSDHRPYLIPYIRDQKDIPILVSIVIAEPDILITGDKDFHTDEIKKYVTVYTPSDFLRDIR